MNLKSEIEYFTELRLLDKARLLNSFLHELAEEARGTYGSGATEVHDSVHLRFANELITAAGRGQHPSRGRRRDTNVAVTPWR
jgi:hypothetical protein